MKRSAILTAVAVLGATSAATAVPLELFIDINTLTATYSGGAGFNTNSSGSITLSMNGNSNLNDVRIDGVQQAISSTLFSFTATINLVNGGVTGGSISTSNADGTSYVASIRNGFGNISTQQGQGFSIDGLTFDGFFGSALYAGVNVTPWFASQPDNGSFLNFAFNPNNNGVDINTDIDLYVLVPMPAAAGLGLAGLAGLGIRRRR